MSHFFNRIESFTGLFWDIHILWFTILQCSIEGHCPTWNSSTSVKKVTLRLLAMKSPTLQHYASFGTVITERLVQLSCCALSITSLHTVRYIQHYRKQLFHVEQYIHSFNFSCCFMLVRVTLEPELITDTLGRMQGHTLNGMLGDI